MFTSMGWVRKTLLLFLEALGGAVLMVYGWLSPQVLVILTFSAFFTCFPRLFSWCFMGKRRWIISLGVLIYLVYSPPDPFRRIAQLWDLSHQASQPQMRPISLRELRSHVFLTERYGEQWHGRQSEQILFRRKSDQTDFLRKPYQVNPNPSGITGFPRFTPFITHGIEGFAIHNARIHVMIRDDIKVHLLTDQHWTFAGGGNGFNEYYTVAPGTVTNRLGVGVLESLFLEFPGPGTYPARYILSCSRTTIGALGDIDGEFDFVIVDNGN